MQRKGSLNSRRWNLTPSDTDTPMRRNLGNGSRSRICGLRLKPVKQKSLTSRGRRGCPMTEDLKELWATLLGNTPSQFQFALWLVKHRPEIVREAIIKTAQKNLEMGGTMSEEHRVRFASSVMNTQTARKAIHEANKAKLSAEFEANGGK